MAIRIGETQVQPAKIAPNRHLQSVVGRGRGVLDVINGCVSGELTEHVGVRSASFGDAEVYSRTHHAQSAVRYRNTHRGGAVRGNTLRIKSAAAVATHR